MITEIIQIAEENAGAIVIIVGFIIALIKQNKSYKKAKAVTKLIVDAWQDDTITESEYNTIIAAFKKEY